MKKANAILAAMSAAALICTAALSVPCAALEKTPEGYVTMSVEKFTIGEGYLIEPTLVPFYEGDTGADLTERLIGKENINGNEGINGYVSEIADPNGGNGTIPASIREAVEASGKTIATERLLDGWLCGYDYTPLGGWMYLQNNESAMSGIADYKPVEGDVIRWSFSFYGYGADLGLDTSSMAEWGGAAPCVTVANRDALTTLLAKTKADGYAQSAAAADAYQAALQTAADLSSDQAALDAAAATLQAAYEAASMVFGVTINNEHYKRGSTTVSRRYHLFTTTAAPVATTAAATTTAVNTRRRKPAETAALPSWASAP